MGYWGDAHGDGTWRWRERQLCTHTEKTIAHGMNATLYATQYYLILAEDLLLLETIEHTPVLVRVKGMEALDAEKAYVVFWVIYDWELVWRESSYFRGELGLELSC